MLTIECIQGRPMAPYAKVVEHIQGHYESEKVPFGRVYRWCTECVVVECGCGERATLTGSMTTCAGCQTDYSAIVHEWLPTERAQKEEGEPRYPWRLVRDCEGESLPC